MQKFEVKKDLISLVPRFKVKGRKIDFKINAVPTGIEPIEWLKSAITDVIQHSMEGAEGSDKIGFTFHGNSFAERGAAWINFKNVNQVQSDDVWTAIARVFQSNSEGMYY